MTQFKDYILILVVMARYLEGRTRIGLEEHSGQHVYKCYNIHSRISQSQTQNSETSHRYPVPTQTWEETVARNISAYAGRWSKDVTVDVVVLGKPCHKEHQNKVRSICRIAIFCIDERLAGSIRSEKRWVYIQGFLLSSAISAIINGQIIAWFESLIPQTDYLPS